MKCEVSLRKVDFFEINDRRKEEGIWTRFENENTGLEARAFQIHVHCDINRDKTLGTQLVLVLHAWRRNS